MPTASEVLTEAWAIHQSGDLARARAMYQAVAEQAPGNANAWCYLGILHYDRMDYDQSERSYREALRIREQFPVAWSNLANTLAALGRFEEGEEACLRALELQPDYRTAKNNLGAIYVKQDRFDAAARLFRDSLADNPDDTDAHRNLGAALIRHGDMEPAAEHSQRAVELDPADAAAHKNLGILSLLRGDFEKGWREYGWRFRSGDAKLPDVSQPMWQGEPLDGKSILLAAEQGLGDVIQFARYARILQQRGAARVVLQCQAALVPLLSNVPGCAKVTATGEPVETDYFVPMISVPAVLKTHDEKEIPAEVGYVTAQPDRVRRWRERLDPGMFHVGIVWQGSPFHQADSQRSIPLQAMAPLAEVPGVRLVSLQKGHGVEQLQEVNDWNVLQFGEQLDADGAFLDSAALIASLDLVVTSDTAVAHLAGAMGAPVWVALCNSPDWRWMLDREDSPWYPSTRLFRQSVSGDWSGVFESMADELRGQVIQSGKGRCRQLLLPASPGELIDKLTILRIKREKLTGEALSHVQRELEELAEVRRRQVVERPKLLEYEQQLQQVNQELWDIEDAVRDCERQQDFGESFVALARSVYRKNDQRADVKRKINELLGSEIVEEKSYADYP